MVPPLKKIVASFVPWTCSAWTGETGEQSSGSKNVARTATTLHTALGAIATLNVALAPYLPFSAQTVHELLGGDGDVTTAGWAVRDVKPGTSLAPARPLYAKVDPAVLDE